MHIALFGGRFDPPHKGHVAIAKEVLKNVAGVDAVWLIPVNTHPWRPIVASSKDRFAMTKLLEKDKIKASDIDIKRGGETYTIDTVRNLQEKTNNTYLWICGADQIHNFSMWKEYQELEKRIPFIVFPRKGYAVPAILPKNFTLMKSNYVATDDNSTEIRDRIKKRLPITDLVSKKIEKYIYEKKLYR